MIPKLLLTAAVAAYVAAAVCGGLVLAAILPRCFAVLVLAVLVAHGFIAGDMLGAIWKLDGQYDDGEVDP